MKAWTIMCDENSVIAFGNTEEEAREKGAFELDSELDYIEAHRSEEYDKYSEAGFVPVEILINNGWWFECFHCYKHVTEETENPVYIKQGVYCSPECQQNRKDEIEEMDSDFEQFQICILQNYTWLDIVKFDGGYPARTAFAEFKIPGAKYTGKISTVGGYQSKPELAYHVSNIDLEVFHKWAKTIKWMI
jgi:hypothetical protein